MNKSIILQDTFWLEWQSEFLKRGLEHQYQKLKEYGSIGNFERVARGDSSGHAGYTFNDSDVYKWLEAASFALSNYPDWHGRELVDSLIRIVETAQDENGYICTPFQLELRGKEWMGLTSKHEMYCMGHLIEAGVAHFRATGEQSLFSIAKRAADHMVRKFGPGKTHGYCGHPEIELALCKLSDVTEESAYRDLARWMVTERGSRPSPFEAEFSIPVSKELSLNYLPLVYPNGEYDGTYFQDDMPLAEQVDAVGHAVRAMYLYCGAVDAIVGKEIQKSLETIWENLVSKRMYVTGGIGSAGDNEGFTRDFDLPNVNAYSETCASIGLVFWARRMCELTKHSKYADIMELALYNAALGGVSLDTTQYFYANPLESRGDQARKSWYGCACCPPNIARLVMSVQEYGGYWENDELTVLVPFSATYSQGDTKVIVESAYPWDGKITISLEGNPTRVRIRIPGWCTKYDASLGQESLRANSDGFLDFQLNEDEKLTIELELRPIWIQCNASVADNYGKVALRYGPLVYCLEEVDLGCPVHLFEPDVSATVVKESKTDRIPLTLKVAGKVQKKDAAPSLYFPIQKDLYEDKVVDFVPYFSWANRGLGSMTVWLRKS